MHDERLCRRSVKAHEPREGFIVVRMGGKTGDVLNFSPYGDLLPMNLHRGLSLKDRSSPGSFPLIADEQDCVLRMGEALF